MVIFAKVQKNTRGTINGILLTDCLLASVANNKEREANL